MRLYLARHGNAVGADVDPARPLSDGGRAEVTRMAKFFEKSGVKVGTFLHSDKVRAEQTAEIYAAHFGAPGFTMRAESGLRPNDPPQDLLPLIASLKTDTLIAGHNPLQSLLVSMLTAGNAKRPVCDLATGAVACLERAPDGGWLLMWLFDPAMVG